MKLLARTAGVLGAAALLLLMCSCRSDVHYQNQAIERARDFLLKNAGDLDWEQREFVRYADPVILHSPVIGEGKFGKLDELHSEQRQICVTWQLPGQKDLYMVFGVSNGRMNFWTPERVIRKKFVSHPTPLAAMAKDAAAYAVNNLYHDLSVVNMNKIRFTPPALLITNFDISVEKPADPVEKAAFEDALAKKIQFTAAWELDNSNSAFFCGRGNPDLTNWQIERAGIISTAELASRTLRTVKTPAESRSELPDLAARNRIGCQCEHAENCIAEGVCRNPVKK